MKEKLEVSQGWTSQSWACEMVTKQQASALKGRVTNGAWRDGEQTLRLQPLKEEVQKQRAQRAR